jgi:RimJ/RimL family protein N-acetyltransferase
MITGSNISLRPIGDEDWPKFEEWGTNREALWGPYQRLQLDHVPLLREIYEQKGLLKRESGMLIIETKEHRQAVGFVRYGMLSIPDADLPCPEIGFGIPEVAARGRGFAQESVKLLVEYLFAGYPVERVTAFTDEENRAAQRVMESVGFRREGVLRRATFRDGLWRDIAVYGILRHEVGVQDPGRENTPGDGSEERSWIR